MVRTLSWELGSVFPDGWLWQIIIATANSNRHAKSVSEKLVDKLKQDKIHIIGVDGQVESGWILVDCGSIVINIMKKEEREFYDLEGLWGEKTLLDASK